MNNTHQKKGKNAAKNRKICGHKHYTTHTHAGTHTHNKKEKKQRPHSKMLFNISKTRKCTTILEKN